jgi:hypothetical protein
MEESELKSTDTEKGSDFLRRVPVPVRTGRYTPPEPVLYWSMANLPPVQSTGVVLQTFNENLVFIRKTVLVFRCVSRSNKIIFTTIPVLTQVRINTGLQYNILFLPKTRRDLAAGSCELLLV